MGDGVTRSRQTKRQVDRVDAWCCRGRIGSAWRAATGSGGAVIGVVVNLPECGGLVSTVAMTLQFVCLDRADRKNGTLEHFPPAPKTAERFSAIWQA